MHSHFNFIECSIWSHVSEKITISIHFIYVSVYLNYTDIDMLIISSFNFIAGKSNILILAPALKLLKSILHWIPF